MKFEVYAQKAQLPKEAISVMKKNHDKIGADSRFLALCKQIYDNVPFADIKKELETFSENVSVNLYELMLLLLMETCDKMENAFRSKGIEERIFLDTVKDFQYKTKECMDVDGVYGISPFTWYQEIFSVEIVALGRLQYQIMESPCVKYTVDGIEILKGDPVYYIHIPSAGPLLPEDVTASLRAAFAFFKERVSGKLIAPCTSWLLYPPYKEKVYAKESNLWKFADRFHIVSYKAYNDPNEFSNAWRVFGTKDVSELSALPADTSLRRNFLRYMREGGTHGTGFGVIVVDENYI